MLDPVQTTPQIAELGLYAQQFIRMWGRAYQTLETALQDTTQDSKFATIVKEALAGDRKAQFCLPYDDNESMAKGYKRPSIKPTATLIGLDGSQAVASRHDAYPFFLINLAWSIYHQDGRTNPRVTTEPTLFFDGDRHNTLGRDITASHVGDVRDGMEVSKLCSLLQDRKEESLCIGFVDQRLQYYPSSQSEKRKKVRTWIDAMSSIQVSTNHLLAGYVSRPETSLLLQTLETYSMVVNGSDPLPDLTITDRHLMQHVLGQYERSCVYKLYNNSVNYRPYMENGQEIGFFYLNVSKTSNTKSPAIARVDFPLWVATRPGAIDEIHASIVRQCEKGGEYPIFLIRADQHARVESQQRDWLNRKIMIEVMDQGLRPRQSAKQQSKSLTGNNTIRRRS